MCEGGEESLHCRDRPDTRREGCNDIFVCRECRDFPELLSFSVSPASEGSFWILPAPCRRPLSAPLAPSAVNSLRRDRKSLHSQTFLVLSCVKEVKSPSTAGTGLTHGERVATIPLCAGSAGTFRNFSHFPSLLPLGAHSGFSLHPCTLQKASFCSTRSLCGQLIEKRQGVPSQPDAPGALMCEGGEESLHCLQTKKSLSPQAHPLLTDGKSGSKHGHFR
jgi:hypothetical protein